MKDRAQCYNSCIQIITKTCEITMQIKRYLGNVIYYKLQIYYWYVPEIIVWPCWIRRGFRSKHQWFGHLGTWVKCILPKSSFLGWQSGYGCQWGYPVQEVYKTAETTYNIWHTTQVLMSLNDDDDIGIATEVGSKTSTLKPLHSNWSSTPIMSCLHAQK